MWHWESLAGQNILEKWNNFFSAKNYCEIKVCTVLVCAIYSIKYGNWTGDENNLLRQRLNLTNSYKLGHIKVSMLSGI